MKSRSSCFLPAFPPQLRRATAVLALLVASATCGRADTVNSTAGDAGAVLGQVRLLKMQAIDHDCDGTPSLPSPDPAVRVSGSSFVSTPLEAIPGECIAYRIVATNDGLTTVTALSVVDSPPAHMLYSAAPVCSTGSAGYSAPTYSCTGITLAPAATATLELRVRVQP